MTAQPPDVAGRPAADLAGSGELVERAAGTAFPASFSDRDTLLIGTGRRAAAEAERAELGRWPRDPGGPWLAA
ncbi:hypothetical protein B0I33_101611 [Prauserella shujinwangii]|uniref:Uncharacterized protein n=1 Tax=Prauserella shujinwangii TaxID=1453103 RepID=A0A2T0M3Z8_9PSEU|nr:hypothetical protein [Prauserella shujinwangii]PRX51457.1 hypothetical protein B0I33_101611 [Prauserella shujinwangii]